MLLTVTNGALLAASAPVVAPTADPVPLCLRALQATSRGRKISTETWRVYTQNLTFDPHVLAQLDAQPEFTLPVWDYVAVMADAERIADGQRLLTEHRAKPQQSAMLSPSMSKKLSNRNKKLRQVKLSLAKTLSIILCSQRVGQNSQKVG